MRRGDKEEIEAFIAAVEKFDEAASEVLNAWEKLGPGLEADPTIVKTYPFDRDFQELLGDIHGWKHEVKELRKQAK